MQIKLICNFTRLSRKCSAPILISVDAPYFFKDSLAADSWWQTAYPINQILNKFQPKPAIQNGSVSIMKSKQHLMHDWKGRPAMLMAFNVPLFIYTVIPVKVNPAVVMGTLWRSLLYSIFFVIVVLWVRKLWGFFAHSTYWRRNLSLTVWLLYLHTTVSVLF